MTTGTRGGCWPPGRSLRAGLLVAPVAVPAGLAIAAALWAWRIYAITTGLAGQTASAPITFDARQWRRQVRAARGRAAAPGTVPLLTRGGNVVIGPAIRAIRHPWRPVLAVPYTIVRPACGHHRLIQPWLTLRLSLIRVCRTVHPVRV